MYISSRTVSTAHFAPNSQKGPFSNLTYYQSAFFRELLKNVKNDPFPMELSTIGRSLQNPIKKRDLLVIRGQRISVF